MPNRIVYILPTLVITLILVTFYSAESSFPLKSTPPSKEQQLFTQQFPEPAPNPVENVIPKELTTPTVIRGIYSTSWIAGSKRMEELIRFLGESGYNALVVDLKDDTGIISFPTEIPLAKEINAGSNRISNLQELVTRLKKENIYSIARIVVFKDPLLAKKHPEIAVKDKNGGLWRDRKGMTWVDPNNRLVWKYNLDLAKEAVTMGFSEIQFDYVRFLSDGKISDTIYPYSNGEPKEDVIRNFLLYAKKDLNSLGIPLSADIFGLVLSVPDDLNIGQNLEKIAGAVDIISPMVYPSHYPKGSFQIAEPDLHPYEIVFQALNKGVHRVKKLNSQVKFRPWLQDFDLGHPYQRQQLADQIRALKDNGINDWLFWNPKNRYEISRYPTE